MGRLGAVDTTGVGLEVIAFVLAVLIVIELVTAGGFLGGTSKNIKQFNTYRIKFFLEKNIILRANSKINYQNTIWLKNRLKCRDKKQYSFNTIIMSRAKFKQLFIKCINNIIKKLFICNNK